MGFFLVPAADREPGEAHGAAQLPVLVREHLAALEELRCGREEQEGAGNAAFAAGVRLKEAPSACTSEYFLNRAKFGEPPSPQTFFFRRAHANFEQYVLC